MAGKRSKTITKVEAEQLDMFAPVEAHAERIDKVKVGLIKNIFIIGTELAKAHEKLARHGNGVFGQWVEERCGIGRHRALNYMRVSEVFGAEDCRKFIQTFDNSAMYLLSAPSTPREALDAAIERADAGEKITHKIAKEIVAKFKPEPKPIDDTFVMHQELQSWKVKLASSLDQRVPEDYRLEFISSLISSMKGLRDDIASAQDN